MENRFEPGGLQACRRRKKIIARTNLKGKKLEIFVPGDEMTLDCLLAGWVLLVRTTRADSESVEWIQAGLDAVNAFAGGGGGGG